MLISPARHFQVMKKTNYKCAICGSVDDLSCGCFIPEWTRVKASMYANLIPLCPDCWSKYYGKFIEIGRLNYLPKVQINNAMRFYREYDKYLYTYVQRYGKYRTGEQLDIERSLSIINSYNHYCIEHSKELDWEKF